MSGLKGITNKDVRRVVQQAERAGCDVRMTKGGHVRIAAPDGGLHFVGTTQPAARTVHNLRTALVRMGVDLNND